MSRLALFVLACALFASITFTFASPVPVVNGELVTLEKRATGRVTFLSSLPSWHYPNHPILQ